MTLAEVGEELLGIVYDRGAPLADRFTAARAWFEVRRIAPEEVDGRHAGELAGMLVASMGATPQRPLDTWDEPTPPPGWAPRTA